MTYFPGTSAGGARNKPDLLHRMDQTNIVKSRFVARNTLEIHMQNGDRVIRLHDTNVLTMHPNGAVELNTGGWNSVTTRDRMNGFAPKGVHVFTEKGVLHVNGKPFRQYATVGPRGGIKTDVKERRIDMDRRELDAFMRAWRQKGLPKTSAGDPWFLLGDNRKVEPRIMRDWVRSKYVFRNFYGYALRYAGISDQGIHYTMYKADKTGLDACDYRRIRRYARVCLGGAS